MRFSYKICSIFLILGFGLSACTSKNTEEGSELIQVTASFYPLAEFARMVGGDKIEVDILVPKGVEPHDYELTPKDMENLESSDLLIVQGGGMEAWFDEDLEEELIQKGVHVLVISEHLQLTEMDSIQDPHTWLSPLMAIETVKIIESWLIELDPKNQDFYKEELQNSIESLEDLNSRFLEQLNSCKQKIILTSHDAFSYLGELYGIEILSIHGISTEDEPSAQDLSELIAELKEKNINYLLIEPNGQTSFTETLSKEADLKTLILDTLESPSGETGNTYIEIMDYNLEILKEAMQCL